MSLERLRVYHASILVLWTIVISGCATTTEYATGPTQPPAWIRLNALGAVPSTFAFHGAPYVTEVVKESPAEKAGFRKDDLILAIGGEPTPSIQKALDSMSKVGSGPVTFTIRRGKTERQLVVTPAAAKPRFGIALLDKNLVLYDPDGVIEASTDKFGLVAVLRELREGILLLDIAIGNRSPHPFTVSPDVVSIKSYGVSLRRLSPEEMLNIVYGPALATLNVSQGELNTYVSQTVVAPPAQPPPAYRIDSTASTFGNMTYGTATARPVPSGGGDIWSGFLQGVMDARAANQAAMAQAMPYLIQRQQQEAREQLIQQYTSDRIAFQRRQLQTVSLPPEGKVEGAVLFDNLRHSHLLELVVEIDGSQRSISFDESKVPSTSGSSEDIQSMRNEIKELIRTGRVAGRVSEAGNAFIQDYDLPGGFTNIETLSESELRYVIRNAKRGQ